jgi:citrate synthase
MLEEIGSVENIPAFIELVKAKKRRLMGFGHRYFLFNSSIAFINPMILEQKF